MLLNFVVSIADDIEGMFKTIHFSTTGSTEREREQATYMFFLDLLHECEGAFGVSMDIYTCMCT